MLKLLKSKPHAENWVFFESLPMGMDGTRVAQSWLEICCPAVLMTRPTRCDSSVWIPYDTDLCSFIKPASFQTDKSKFPIPEIIVRCGLDQISIRKSTKHISYSNACPHR